MTWHCSFFDCFLSSELGKQEEKKLPPPEWAEKMKGWLNTTKEGLDKNKWVGDWGCGTGRFSKAWVESGGFAWGADQSKLSLGFLKEKLESMSQEERKRLVWSHASISERNPQWGNGEKGFEGGFCWNSSIHYSSINEFHAQWRQFQFLIKKSGYWVIDVPIYEEQNTEPSVIENLDWVISTRFRRYVRHQHWRHASGQEYNTRMRIWPKQKWRSWLSKTQTQADWIYHREADRPQRLILICKKNH